MRLNRATNIGLVINVFLFVIKLIAGIISNSIAIISEAINSLTDIISSIAIKYSVRISKKGPDEKHQYGHNAAQPLAAFVVAVFAFVLGIKLIEESIERIITPKELFLNNYIYLVLIITIVTKILLSRYQKHIGIKYSSTALKAAAIDSFNDVLTSSIALLGIITSSFGYYYIDGIAGFLVATFILKTGYDVAKENIDFLMGKAADKCLIEEIAKLALETKDVTGINDLKSYYVGDKLHIEIHIELDKNMTLEQSHDVGKEVQHKIEGLPQIQQAFVHIDPV